jgi:hypothetical protein
MDMAQSRHHLRTLAACASLLAVAGAARAFDPLPVDGTATGDAAQAGCEGLDVHACVDQAIDAMGGRVRLEGLHAVRYKTVGHRVLAEQSYRPAPFIAAYQRDELTIDFAGGRVMDVRHSTWPEADPGQSESDQTLVATPAGGVYRALEGDQPCQPNDVDEAAEMLALGPERILLTAAVARDLRWAPPRWLRGTRHAAVRFGWHGHEVEVLIDGASHLPDAVSQTRVFHDYWYVWGDVEQRVLFDNWFLTGGLVLPFMRLEQRDGQFWQSVQVTDVASNPTIDAKAFAMESAVAARAVPADDRETPFKSESPVSIAPGIMLYPGPYNATLIRQDDGVLMLEAPRTSTFVRGVLAKARSEFPGLPLVGVLSTSSSWPHIGGVREVVAQGLPVWVRDVNLPDLDRLVTAPHRLRPDPLQESPMPARWNVAANGTEVGRGDNRVVLYPLPGPSTARQYMVYFPGRRLLYASDTLVLNDDKTIYDPQLVHEVAQAVERLGLAVDTVWAMHQGPVAWQDVLAQLKKSLG